MFKILSFLLFLSTNSFSESININGYITIWEKPGEDAIPKPLIKNIPVAETLYIPEKPQTFDLKKFIYISSQTYNLNIEISFFSIFQSQGQPYFVSQMKVSGDINIICGGYFNKDDFIPFPVLYCSQIIREKQIGITLHRILY